MWTYPPRSILVAVDFGAASVRALALAQAIARRHHAAVTALHAETLDVPPYFTLDQISAVQRQREGVRREAERYLEAFVRDAAPGAVSTLVEGHPAASILAAAGSHDLLVMGTHGRRGPSRWWAGSVAERVVRDSPIPVLVVRPENAPAAPEAAFARPVAVAGPEFSQHARAYAAGLAESFGGTMGAQSVSSFQDLSCSPEATLLAVAVGTRHGGAGFGDTAETLVRQCQLPMLFIPHRS